MFLLPGSQLGPYEIVGPLGAGGMGEVYRARDPRLSREVAIKVLPANVASDPDRRARFEREARAVAALSHPNILAIFDVGAAPSTSSGQSPSTSSGHTTFYAVTELLEGETLRELVNRGALPVRRAIDIAMQIARGLAAAHDKGLVHRDLKPENIFLLDDGQVKILDFGLAKTNVSDAGDGETVGVTNAGTVLGTVGYMAPEQIRGEAVDARADIFALGAVLYEMLSGRRAFQRDSAAETMTAILKDDPPELTAARADLPPSLDTIVRHCLERNVAERFQSVRDLAFNLQSTTHVSGSGAARTPTTPRRRLSRREAIAWLLVAVLTSGAIATLALGRTTLRPVAVGRFQVNAPDRTFWAAPLGSPEGSNGGAISPDGTTLAFVAADAAGRTLLFVRPLDSFVARPLAGTDGAAFPFWSPDSRQIGFFTQTRLKRIATEGGPAQTVCDLSSTPRGGAWNRQGVILFSTAGSPIFRISADGGQPVQVTTPTSDNAAHQWPSFLPDDRHFLYYSASSHVLYIGSLDGGPDKRLMQSDTNAVFVPPNQLIFMQESTLLSRVFDLSRLAVSGEARPIADQVASTASPWNLGAFSASSTGTVTYRLGGSNRSQFTWMDRAGHVLSTVGPPGDYLSPSLSRDETKLAFGRRDDQPAGDIWTLDMAKQTLSRVTFTPRSELYPMWSADGTALIYDSIQDGLMADTLGGGTTKLFSAASNGLLVPCDVSSDGRLIVFFADLGGSTGFDVYTLPRAGDAKPTPVIHGPFTEAEASLSPDQHWIAYASTETGNYETFVEPFPTTGARWQISTGGGRQPMWRSDGRELFFVTNDRKLYAVDVRPGETFEFGTPRLLFELPANTISVRNSYIPTRDGQRFLVNKLIETAVPPINIVLSWSSTQH